MTPTRTQQIRNKAIFLLKETSEGLRFTELQRKLKEIFSDFPENTIMGATWNLHETHNNRVYKPTRGLFKHTDYRGEEEITEERIIEYSEEDFYEPFARWIKNDLGDCTEAVSLGGNCLSRKWGTPDVIGIYKPSLRDVIKFQPEIIAAEIKIDPSVPITAFGQAVTYRLFSSKVYLVEPNTIQKENLDRIEALCVLYGLGLVLFDLNPEDPNFSIRVRAQRFIPDMFYVNEFADKLYSVKRSLFNRLFG